MKKESVIIRGTQKVDVFKPHREAWYKPEIVRMKVIAGVEYYIGKDGKKHLKSRFDFIWNPPKLEVKPEHYKGENPCKKHVN